MIIPFSPEHLAGLHAQPTQQYMKLTKELGESMLILGPCRSIVWRERVIGCCGLMEHWPGRAEFWGVYEAAGFRGWVEIHRDSKLLIAEHLTAERGMRRIETVVLGKPDGNEFLAGHRWATAMGFRYEGYMGSYTPAPEHLGMSLYALIREPCREPLRTPVRA